MAEGQAEKLHAACDECRTRKLKCSGDHPECNRCEREKIRCHYSPQKQMGRPRKRRREEGDIPAEVSSTNRRTSNVPNIEASQIYTEAPSFDEFTLASAPDLNDFPGFADFGSHDAMVDPMLLPQDHDFSLTNGYAQEYTHSHHFPLDPAIDPSLWNAQPTASTPSPAIASTPTKIDEPPCTCLSLSYLTLTELQTMSTFSFPAVVPLLRSAMKTISTIIHCEECPKGTFSGIQNTQSLSALLSAVGERFHRVLNIIDEEAERLDRTGEKKPYRIGDGTPSLQHLHTGKEDCPMGFNIHLSGADWKSLAKKALKTEVMGGGSNPMPLVMLIEQFKLRQITWHTNNINLEERTRLFGEQNTCKDGDAQCLRMISAVRALITRMNFD